MAGFTRSNLVRQGVGLDFNHLLLSIAPMRWFLVQSAHTLSYAQSWFCYILPPGPWTGLTIPMSSADVTGL